MNSTPFPSASHCSDPEFTYLDTPESLQLILHIISIISTPIYCLGVYCILFKTPKEMRSVKWYLFILHFWIIIFDYLISVLCIPYLLVPAPAGIPYGVLRYLGVPTSVQTVITTVVLNYMFISIISIYENRFFILCEFRFKSQWTLIRRVWLSAHYLLIVVFFIPVFTMIPDQETARDLVFEILPCLPSFLYLEPIFVLALDYTYHMSMTLPVVSIQITELSLFVYLLVRDFLEKRKTQTMSEKTYQMHRQFFIAILAQVTIPFAQLGVPVTYLLISILIGYRDQAAINGCVIIATTHGFVSTVVMVWVHKPYRLAVRRMIGIDRSDKEQRKSTVLSVQSNR